MVEVWIRPWRAEPATAATRRGRSQAPADLLGVTNGASFWNFARETGNAPLALHSRWWRVMGLTWVLRPTCHSSLRLGPLSPAARPRPSPSCPRKRPSKRLGTKRRCTRAGGKGKCAQPLPCLHTRGPTRPSLSSTASPASPSAWGAHKRHRTCCKPDAVPHSEAMSARWRKRDIEDRQRAIIMVPLFVMAWQIGAVIDLQDPETAKNFWLAEGLLNSFVILALIENR